MEQIAKMRLVTPQRTPRLRFPGFSGEWERKTLEEIGIINPSNNGLPEKFYYIDLESVNKGIAKNLKFMNKETAPSRAQRILQKNDILFQTVRPYQQNNYLFQVIKEYPVVASTGYAQIRCKQNNPRFIYQALHQKSFLQKVLVRCTGGTYPAINSGDLKEIKITIPSLPEQEKIADFFTAMDEKIDAKEKEIEEVKTLKKGFLQQLFPQEGETVPRLRFPGFSGAWEKKKLGEILEDFSYGMNSAAMPYDGIHKYIRITDIDDESNKYKEDSLASPQGKLERKYLVSKNDILFARTGASVGKTYLYNPKDGILYYAGFLIKGHVKAPIIAKFVFLQTLSNQYYKWVKIMSARTGQPGINAEEYKSYTISIPPLPEQEKIADFFTAIDEKIEAMEKQRDALKAMKKGFLQQMFI